MSWPILKLGDICRIELGKTPSRSNPKFWDVDKVSNNVWLSIADLPLSIKPVMSDSKEYITNEGANICKVVPKGTLIVSFKLSLGRLAITGRDLYTNEAIAALYINQDIELEQDYLYWYLIFFDWNAAAGSDIKVKGKTLNKAKLKELKVPIPPLPEQKRIVALLDTVFADLEQTRVKTEQNLKNSRELFDSYLQQVFSQKDDGWVEDVFDNILEIRSGRNQKTVLDPNGEYPIYGSAGKVMGRANSYICEENTTIIGRKGTINSPMYMTTKFWNVDTAFGLIAGDKLHNKFLFYFCKSFDFSNLDKGTTLPSLVKKDLVRIVMPFPKLDEQVSLVKKLDELSLNIEKVKNIYSEKLSSIDELKKSILQKAFSGELTATAEQPEKQGIA